jgi:Family of unknown function (DUF6912)
MSAWLAAGEAEPVDGVGFAVTPDLIEVVGAADEEELGLTALGAAARASLALVRAGSGGNVATVLAVDLEPGRPVAGAHPAHVLQPPVPRNRWLAGYVGDSAALAAADLGAQSPDDDSLLAGELAWYGVQELPDLFA